MSPKSERDHIFSCSKFFNGLPPPILTRVRQALSPHSVLGFTAATVFLCSLCSRLPDPHCSSNKRAQPRGPQRFSSAGMLLLYIASSLLLFSGPCSNTTYQRLFPTNHPIENALLHISFILKSFFFRALLAIPHLTCLLSLSHHKNVNSGDQGPLSGKCDSEAGNSVTGWSLQRGSASALASGGPTRGS